MKNKKLKWLLIPLVLILWGIIGYQIYSGVKGEVQVIQEPKAKPSVIATTQDTLSYVLNLDYPDPFLKNRKRINPSYTSSTNNAPSSPTKPKVKATVVLKPLRWPSLTYKGQLEKKGSKTPMCIVEIDKTLFFMRKGEEQDGVKLLHVFTDSVQVAYKAREKKTLYR